MACVRLIYSPYCRFLFRRQKFSKSQSHAINIIKEYLSNKVQCCEYSSKINVVKEKERNSVQTAKELDLILSNQDHKLVEKYKVNCLVPYNDGDSLDTFKELLSETYEHPKNSFAVIKLLNKKITSTRTQNRTQFINIIKSTNEFKELCTNLENYLPFASGTDLIIFLNFAHYFNLNNNDPLITKALLLAVRGINRFSTSEAAKIFLMTLEKSWNKNEISQSLQSASMNFIYARAKENDLDEISDAAAAYFASQPGLPNVVRMAYLNMISNGVIKSSNPDTFTCILRGLYVVNMDKDQIYNLFSRTIILITRKINIEWPILDVKNISTLASKLLIKYHFEFDNDYHNYLEKIAAYTIETRTNAFSAMKFMYDFCHVNYLNTFLLDYILKAVVEEEELVKEKELLKIMNLLRILSYTGFPESCPNQLKNKIINKIQSADFSTFESSDEKKKHFTGVIDSGLGLASIDLLIPSILEKIFQILNRGYRERNFDPLILNCDWNVLLLYKWATEKDPAFNNSLSKEILDLCLMSISKKQKFTWRTNLETALGGKQFLLTNCTLYSKFTLSYIFILDSENKPVDLSLYKTASIDFPISAELIRVPDNCKIVALQELYSGLNIYFKNVPLEKARLTLFRNVLKNLGYNVILLDSYDTIELEDFEKPLYLQSVIERNFGKINK